MTWTYPADDGPIDLVRLKVGDTVKNDPQLSDEEIQSLLENQPPLYAAAAAARAIAARYTRAVNRSIGRLKIDTASRAGAYLALAKTLDAEARVGAVPLAGGQSVSAKREPYADPDVVEPLFTRDAQEVAASRPLLLPGSDVTV